MNDVMALLKDRRAKVEARLARAVKSLEMVRKELADLQAAERVMGEITGESPESKSSGSISDRDKEIAKLLEIGQDSSISPIDLHPRYVEATGDGINLDAFRTALWRLQKKVIQGDECAWIIRSDSGRYWREEMSEADDFDQF